MFIGRLHSSSSSGSVLTGWVGSFVGLVFNSVVAVCIFWEFIVCQKSGWQESPFPQDVSSLWRWLPLMWRSISLFCATHLSVLVLSSWVTRVPLRKAGPMFISWGIVPQCSSVSLRIQGIVFGAHPLWDWFHARGSRVYFILLYVDVKFRCSLQRLLLPSVALDPSLLSSLFLGLYSALCLCLDHTGCVTMALRYSLRSCMIMAPPFCSGLFWLFWVLCIHISFRIFFS